MCGKNEQTNVCFLLFIRVLLFFPFQNKQSNIHIYICYKYILLKEEENKTPNLKLTKSSATYISN